jgi:hypothetical protein
LSSTVVPSPTPPGPVIGSTLSLGAQPARGVLLRKHFIIPRAWTTPTQPIGLPPSRLSTGRKTDLAADFGLSRAVRGRLCLLPVTSKAKEAVFMGKSGFFKTIFKTRRVAISRGSPGVGIHSWTRQYRPRDPLVSQNNF